MRRFFKLTELTFKQLKNISLILWNLGPWSARKEHSNSVTMSDDRCNENSREVTREVWDEEEGGEEEDRFCPLLARDNSVTAT